jgi:hypothetical protein
MRKITLMVQAETDAEALDAVTIAVSAVEAWHSVAVLGRAMPDSQPYIYRSWVNDPSSDRFISNNR